MPLLPALPRAEATPERLDGLVAFPERAESLRDVARLNALFGGRRLTVRHVARLAASLPPNRPLTVLDVGTGGADVPVALVRWARRAGRPIRVLALDHDRDTLQVARRGVSSYPEIVLIRGDARALPVRSGGVDVVISALTLHHLEPDDAALALDQIAAASRAGYVVNDLERSPTGLLLVWLVTRLLARSPLSRHDGPLSVRRAYTAAEALALCGKAGLLDATIRRYPLHLRFCVVRPPR
jgi:2-polyprenyl-3-methyl-5-hydroxy-6-metoxy-1,4-benzoquinol methylase